MLTGTLMIIQRSQEEDFSCLEDAAIRTQSHLTDKQCYKCANKLSEFGTHSDEYKTHLYVN